MGNWDEATVQGNFVKFEEGKPKLLVLTNQRLAINPKLDNKWEFSADVILEDNEAPKILNGKQRLFSTTSKRLLAKLRPLFENKDIHLRVAVQIIKVGDGYDTQYSVLEQKN